MQKQEAGNFIDDWQALIALKTCHNYYYWLAVEVYLQIKVSGSI
jgi:hypothetical protein